MSSEPRDQIIEAAARAYWQVWVDEEGEPPWDDERNTGRDLELRAMAAGVDAVCAALAEQIKALPGHYQGWPYGPHPDAPMLLRADVLALVERDAGRTP